MGLKSNDNTHCESLFLDNDYNQDNDFGGDINAVTATNNQISSSNCCSKGVWVAIAFVVAALVLSTAACIYCVKMKRGKQQ